ncbi:MAG: L-histidine N(alpha)-methyltransferase, partial [Chthoniobacterales bacterium]
RAVYNRELHRIEMHLVARAAQQVHLGGRTFDFASGEKIITEYSYKHTPEGFAALASEAGFKLSRQWTDAQRLFAVFHFIVAD